MRSAPIWSAPSRAVHRWGSAAVRAKAVRARAVRVARTRWRWGGCHNGSVSPESRSDGGGPAGAAAGGARLLALVGELHATPQRTVLAFAGAGAEALALLHAVGGSSRTVLEAVDLYADRSMTEWVGFTPAQFTSQRTAKAMAEAAWRRARHLTAGERVATTHPPADAEGGSVRVPVPVFGLACTASIATDRAKKGEHRVVVAVRDGFGTASYAITFEKGARDRAGEERVVSQLVLRAAADACGVLRPTPLGLTGDEALEVAFAPAPLLAQFDAGERPYVVVREDGTLTSELTGASWEGDPRDGARLAPSRGSPSSPAPSTRCTRGTWSWRESPRDAWTAVMGGPSSRSRWSTPTRVRSTCSRGAGGPSSSRGGRRWR